jgi:hypothetical protein
VDSISSHSQTQTQTKISQGNSWCQKLNNDDFKYK